MRRRSRCTNDALRLGRSMPSAGSGSGLASRCRQALRDAGSARWCLLLLGLLFVALGAVGAVLPVLPTMPFLLLAAACFVRSSPEFHQRRLANRVFGPSSSQWQSDRTVPRDAKREACGVVVVTLALSIALVGSTWLRAALGAVGIALISFLARIPTPRRGRETGRDPDQQPVGVIRRDRQMCRRDRA